MAIIFDFSEYRCYFQKERRETLQRVRAMQDHIIFSDLYIDGRLLKLATSRASSFSVTQLIRFVMLSEQIDWSDKPEFYQAIAEEINSRGYFINR